MLAHLISLLYTWVCTFQTLVTLVIYQSAEGVALMSYASTRTDSVDQMLRNSCYLLY